MNGKLCKALRKIAKTVAHSHKETATQGVRGFKSVKFLIHPLAINAKDGIFYQRILHPMSIGAITKKMKRIVKATSRPLRKYLPLTSETLIGSDPEMFGVPVKAKCYS